MKYRSTFGVLSRAHSPENKLDVWQAATLHCNFT